MLSDQKIVGNGFYAIGILVTGNCIHQGFIRKVVTHRIGQIGKQRFLEFSDMVTQINVSEFLEYFEKCKE